jgi:hypothetical protein
LKVLFEEYKLINKIIVVWKMKEQIYL